MSEAELTRSLGAELLTALSQRLPNALRRAEIAAALADAVARDLNDRDPDLTREAARLHEIGKLYVPAELLTRPPAELGTGEWTTLSEHHQQGRDLALGAGLPPRAAALILHARERYDGGGPGGLIGSEIPLGSRIIAACAEYLDAPLRPGAPQGDPLEIALARLSELAGTRLDPLVVASATAAAGGGPGRSQPSA